MKLPGINDIVAFYCGVFVFAVAAIVAAMILIGPLPVLIVVGLFLFVMYLIMRGSE